jgi:hypothetical protein
MRFDSDDCYMYICMYDDTLHTYTHISTYENTDTIRQVCSDVYLHLQFVWSIHICLFFQFHQRMSSLYMMRMEKHYHITHQSLWAYALTDSSRENVIESFALSLSRFPANATGPFCSGVERENILSLRTSFAHFRFFVIRQIISANRMSTVIRIH